MLSRVIPGALALALLACARSTDLPTSQDFKLNLTVTPEATSPLNALK
jgi:hypothetical protein